MKPARNRVSFLSFIGEAEATLKQIFYEQPRDWLIEARVKMRDLPKTNFDLGCKFAEMGKWHDALFRFRIALWLQPNYPQALYNVGCSYYRLGNIPKARAALKQVVQQTPSHQDAIFMLSAIDPRALPENLKPQAMPKQLVTKFFTSIAENYTQAEAANKYRGGIAVAEQVKPLLPAGDLIVIDLGCGTGIAAIPFRPIARELVGVDVTPAMVAQAGAQAQQDKKLYNQVITADIAALGDTIPAGEADLVLLVNVVQFIGALQGVMASAARLLKTGGFVALTIEPYDAPAGFGVVADTGRFGHSSAYVRQIAAGFGLALIKDTKLGLYPDVAAANLLLFRKGTN